MGQPETNADAKQIAITLVRSAAGYEKTQGRTARALGLGRRGRTVVQPDNASVRGMVFKIRHLVEVSDVSPSGQAATEAQG
jgi:large subunit ribosomal protein L30